MSDIILKPLPLGEQNFREIVENNKLYVDKTDEIFKLLDSKGKYFLLSRPRRFGKSLLISTLGEIFLGNKELFKDLYIYDKIEWKKYPVISITMNKLVYTNGFEEFKSSLFEQLKDIYKHYNLEVETHDFILSFKNLIQNLSKQGKVVLLIDEYDKPLTEYIEDIEKSKEMRAIMKNFYEIIKASDEYLHFTLLTGVSKFSKVSIFSTLNNLNDITMDEKYSKLVGIDEAQLYSYFADRIVILAEKFSVTPDIIKKEIKNWYNGYSWDGKNFLYNPFSIISLFTKNKFNNYWFETGTPTFLIKKIRESNIDLTELESLEAVSSTFEIFDIENLNVYALLFQTGYLTIKEVVPFGLTENYILSDPNMEVRESLTNHLLGSFTNQLNKSGTTGINMAKSIIKNNIDDFIKYARALFASIPYDLVIKDREAYYHTVFYLVLTLLGVHVECEVHTSMGRIDAVIKNNNQVYILEFKIGLAETALQQIEDRKYHEKYLANNEVTLIGIGFDLEARNIGDYLVKKV